MAQHKSAIKRIRQSEKARLRNLHYKSMLKGAIKKVREAQSKEEAEVLYRKATSVLDRLVVKGIIHKNKAANQKSKLARVVSAL